MLSPIFYGIAFVVAAFALVEYAEAGWKYHPLDRHSQRAVTLGQITTLALVFAVLA